MIVYLIYRQRFFIVCLPLLTKVHSLFHSMLKLLNGNGFSLTKEAFSSLRPCLSSLHQVLAPAATLPPPEMTEGAIVLGDGVAGHASVCVGCWGLFFFCVWFYFVFVVPES